MAALSPEHRRRVVCAFAQVRAAALSITGIAALTACFLVIVGLRRLAGAEPLYGFVWLNLMLAWIPLVLAYALAWSSQRQVTLMPVLAAVWIVFLPNAPYLMTDLVHLSEGVSVPNVGTLLLLGVIGLLIGVRSVQIVQDVVEERFGVEAGWSAVRIVVVLAGVGVYVGRVLRWNSWYVVSHPRELASSALRSSSEPGKVALALVATVVFAIFFYATYCLLADQHERPARVTRERSLPAVRS
jgi:uncharacterized membrane protein